MKERIYKLFLTLLVSLSLGAGPIAQHEIAKLLEMFVETGDAQIQELDDEENESEEIRKKKEERRKIGNISIHSQNTNGVSYLCDRYGTP